FTLLEHFPFGGIMSFIAIFLIATFFITSADSATFVLGTLTSNGNLNPPNAIKFTWGIIQSVVAAVLLWSGGLKGLQTGSILAAFPFAVIILLLMLSLFRSFREEMRAGT
ncbi:MAG: glycine/betaine ABC transporter permease, partial [Nitrospira sp. SB0667_bin_9]|nr:glycine/betaine ABC transporter permease [Nitrospira sp. SB0667_bin_9]